VPLLETIVVDHTLHDKFIEILQVDLTDMTHLDKVDVLVVSAFPGDYTPTPTSLIGSLHARGVSVGKLAERKQYDLRRDFSCWLSEPIPESTGMGFHRILCFEPPPDGLSPPETRIDNIFRALAPFIGLAENPITSVAMPIVTAGDMGIPINRVAEPLIRAAIHWMKTSPLHRVRIATRGDAQAGELLKEAKRVKESLLGEQTGAAKTFDIFLSYSRQDSDIADLVVTALRNCNPQIRVFQDVSSLNPGIDYRVQLDRAVRASKRFVPLFTEDYLRSKSCQDEFNAAWSIRERHDPHLLFPIFVRGDRPSDPRMAYVQYEDCRDSDVEKINMACRKITYALSPMTIQA